MNTTTMKNISPHVYKYNFSSVQFYLYIAKSQQSSQCTVHSKVNTLQNDTDKPNKKKERNERKIKLQKNNS